MPATSGLIHGARSETLSTIDQAKASFDLGDLSTVPVAANTRSRHCVFGCGGEAGAGSSARSWQLSSPHSCNHTAVDQKIAAGDKAGIWAKQIRCGKHNLLRWRHALHRRCLDHSPIDVADLRFQLMAGRGRDDDPGLIEFTRAPFSPQLMAAACTRIWFARLAIM